MAPSSNIAEAIANLTTKVEKTVGVEESAIALIQGFAQQVRDNKDAPAALDALADKMDAEATSLGDAIAANPA